MPSFSILYFSIGVSPGVKERGVERVCGMGCLRLLFGGSGRGL